MQLRVLDGVVIVHNRLIIGFSRRGHSVLVGVVHRHLRALTKARTGKASRRHLLRIGTVLIALLLPIHVGARLLFQIVLLCLALLLFDLLNRKVGVVLL